ncbi:uncharacterized protein LOC107043537 [Diachasma alloeum]|uniref:uncharacterized protein LOC107043537 n=1 Tax=Diachasma alloeum TaxID=454923 RepID=UPI00073840DC|nr:uncharacterized protein LOC107043537 [Diachasma alloeum]
MMDGRLERDRWTRNESHKRHRDITRGLQVEISGIGDTGYLFVDPFLELESRSVMDSLSAFAEILTDWYQNACVVTGAAVSDIKTLWIITSGSYLHKGKIVGKLVSYYLIVLAIYMIETALWVDRKIIEVLSGVIVEAKE